MSIINLFCFFSKKLYIHILQLFIRIFYIFNVQKLIECNIKCVFVNLLFTFYLQLNWYKRQLHWQLKNKQNIEQYYLLFFSFVFLNVLFTVAQVFFKIRFQSEYVAHWIEIKLLTFQIKFMLVFTFPQCTHLPVEISNQFHKFELRIFLLLKGIQFQ